MISDPAKETEPTTIVNAVAARSNVRTSPSTHVLELEQRDQGRGAATDAVEQRHHLRHLRHLDPLRADQAADGAERDRGQDQRHVVEVPR